MATDRRAETSTLRHYLHVVRRQKWIVLASVVLIPAVAVLLSLRQRPLYLASSEVLLSHQNLAAALTNTSDTQASNLPDRVAATQAELARVPLIAARTLKVLKIKGRTVDDFLAVSSAAARQNADLLDLTVADPDPYLAVRLVNEYARQYTVYRLQLDTASLERARKEVQQSVEALLAAGDRKTPLYADLVSKAQQLQTMEALQTANAFVVRQADTAGRIRPKPTRNGVLGLFLGIVFGIGLAFLREALDTRLRNSDEVAERLGIPLLARLPEPSRKHRTENQLVMLEEPEGSLAEIYRVLRTNVEFANLERKARTIMVTSAVEAEGKSTTIANLAVALARAGRRVILVDLDLRRPFLDRFFNLEDRPGLTHVALGRVTLDEALTAVPIIDVHPGNHGASGNGHGTASGLLEVLTCGPVPPNAGEFATSSALGDIIEKLRARAEIVLIDAPPLLQVGDAIALSAKVDAMMIVTRLTVVRRPMMDELHRVLGTCPADKLGFVLTGADATESYGYGYGYGSGRYGERPPEPAEREPGSQRPAEHAL